MTASFQCASIDLSIWLASAFSLAVAKTRASPNTATRIVSLVL